MRPDCRRKVLPIMHVTGGIAEREPQYFRLWPFSGGTLHLVEGFSQATEAMPREWNKKCPDKKLNSGDSWIFILARYGFLQACRASLDGLRTAFWRSTAFQAS